MPETKRCPMCGKDNPADAEVCKYCQAQLKPIIGGSTTPAPDSSSQGRDEIDWLRNLSGADSASSWENAPDESSPAEEEDDDFLLSRLNLTSTPPEEKEPPAPVAERPAAPDLPPPDDQEEEGNADWLQILERSSGKKENSTHIVPDENNADLDEWLNNLGKEAGPTPAASEDQPPPKRPRKITDRLKEDLNAQPGADDAWMDALRKTSDEPAEDETPFTSPSAQSSSVFTSDSVDRTGSLMQWLDDETPFSEDTASEEDTLLSGLLDEEPSAPVAPSDTDMPAADLPDWLQDMAPAAPEASSPAAGSLGSSEDELPPWLQEDSEHVDSSEPASALDDTNDKEISGLLSSLKRKEQPATQEPAAPFGESAFAVDAFSETPSETESVFPFGGDLPIEEDGSEEDNFLIGNTPPFEEEADETEKASLGDLPDWLNLDDSTPSENTPADTTVSPFSTAPQEDSSPLDDESLPPSPFPFDNSLPFQDDSDLPDWLAMEADPASEEDQPQEEPSLGIDASPFAASPFDDVPLESKESAPAETPFPAGGDESVHPFAADGLPDWLDSEEAKEIIPEIPGGEKQAENLSPAQLPGWLAAMRPVESVTIEDGSAVDDHIEKSGPLAGLRGVLPADQQAIKYRKPPVYSVKLKVTETQAAHASLFEDLLQREHKPSEAKRIGTQGSKRLMQLVVALVLIVVLLVFRGAGAIIETPGRPYLSPFVSSFYNEIEALPENSAVLLAVDYAPGYSGEMKAASTAVIQRLMTSKQRISVISTVPSGPALAEDLLQHAFLNQQTQDPAYTLNTHTINLGYLPGGLTSLKEFSLRPKQAARYGLTTQYDGLIPWDHPALSGVDTLTGFSAVIVITDSVDSGRAWVEQVQPALSSVPMLLIASAQAAPMMEPYVQSGQLSGMLSGLAGSVSYENTLQQPGAGHAYWIALQGGLAVVIALILVGILFELFISLVASRKQQSEA